ncbi:MAG: hypothetical protein LBH06_01075 [Rikenellaceae bacterium]|nr:hypothetical protein [Rikenellaceae bacterium]
MKPVHLLLIGATMAAISCDKDKDKDNNNDNGADKEDFGAGATVDNTFNVGSDTQWNAAVAAIKNGGDDKNYVINLLGDFSLPWSTEPTFGNLAGIKVSIRGNKKIALTSNGHLLRVDYDQTVILRGAILEGIAGNDVLDVFFIDGNYFSLVRVVAGELTMHDGEIRNNITHIWGGGVYVSSCGSFTMTGGTISENTAYSGGGVRLDDNSSFTMRGAIC